MPGDHVLNPGFVMGDATLPRRGGADPGRRAAPEASVLLTQRTPHLSAHAGQIAFPGGKIDPTDASPDRGGAPRGGGGDRPRPALVETIGDLDPYLTGTGYRIVPVRGDGRSGPPPDAQPARGGRTPSRCRSSFLMTPDNHRRGSREFRGATRYFYEMPFKEHYIWGITAGIIRGLYERVFGMMPRLIAFNAIFFLLPFAIYAAWLVATRGTVGTAS